MKNKITLTQQEETIEILLTPEIFPLAFRNKVEELFEQKVFETIEECENWVKQTPIILEVIYEKDYGLFAVESETLECGNLVKSPYTQKEFEIDNND